MTIDLGGGNSIELRNPYEAVTPENAWGGELVHSAEDGYQCRDWIPFNGRRSGTEGWDVVSPAPLTLAPSIYCRVCGRHGYIRDGKWVDC